MMIRSQVTSDGCAGADPAVRSEDEIVGFSSVGPTKVSAYARRRCWLRASLSCLGASVDVCVCVALFCPGGRRARGWDGGVVRGVVGGGAGRADQAGGVLHRVGRGVGG
eukprot:3935500-Rhodomonas_salina.1